MEIIATFNRYRMAVEYLDDSNKYLDDNLKKEINIETLLGIVY